MNMRKCLKSTSPRGHASLIVDTSRASGLRPTSEMNAHLRSCLLSHPLSPESNALKLAATDLATSASDIVVPPQCREGCRSPGTGWSIAVDISTHVGG